MESGDASGSVSGTLGTRWHANDVVPADQLLGRVDERFRHESASSKHVGISHGLSLGADVAPALSRISFESAQPS